MGAPDKETTEHRGHEVDVYITAGPGDAVEKAAKAVREGCDVVWPLEETGQ